MFRVTSFGRYRLPFLILGILAWACQPAGSPSRGTSEEPAEVVAAEIPAVAMAPGQIVERAILPGESHPFIIHLEQNQFAVLTLKQRNIDLKIHWEDDVDGLGALDYDSPTGLTGTETVWFLAPGPREFRVRVEAFPDSQVLEGGFRLSLEVHSATAEDSQRFAAHRHSTLAFQLDGAGDSLQAIKHSERALVLWRETGERRWETSECLRLGNLLWELEDRKAEAEEVFRHGLALAEPLGEEILEGHLANGLGASLAIRGRVEEARGLYRRALEIGERRGELTMAATALKSLGSSHWKAGELYQALVDYLHSVRLWNRVQDQKEALDVLVAIGRIYLRVHDDSAALDIFQRALSLAEVSGEDSLQFQALLGEGRAHLRLGDLPTARAFLSRALEQCRRLGPCTQEAYTEFLLGEVDRLEGSFPEAQAHFESALNLSTDPTIRGLAWMHLERVAESRGDAKQALRYAHACYQTFEDRDDSTYLASAHWVLARAHLAAGNPEVALQEIDEALGYVEIEQRTVEDPEWRAGMLDFRYPYYVLKVEILLQLEERSPGEGYEAAAFTLIDTARGRNLLEGLVHPGGTIDNVALKERAAVVWQRIRRLDQHPDALPPGGGLAGDYENLEMRGLLAEYRFLLSQLRQQRRLDADEQTPQLSLEAMQAFLEPDTRVLSFLLGEEESYLWVLGPDSLHTYLLPGRSWVERAAERLSRGLSTVPPRARSISVELQKGLERFAEALLGEALPELDGIRRWVILPDGALHSFPFAALIHPDSGEFLVERHSITYLPSLATLAQLQWKQQQRPAPSALLGLMADGVFDPRDERFPASRSGAGVSGHSVHGASAFPSAVQAGLGRFDRLAAAAREARQILSLVPSAEQESYLDFAARREVLLEGKLAKFRYVHLIAHGEIDLEYPELTSLVFSTLDKQGEPIDGLVRSHEIYDLELSADLVVLSACETALGKVNRGEGAMSFARGFFHIGVPRVVVSLWRIQDDTTADLMSEFYRALLVDRLPPSEALQKAQIALLKEYPHPYYWAPFVFQGDWR
jgi:CHAT domain-containing protein